MEIERIVLDLSDWLPDKPYDECLELCEQLGLIETVQHGEDQYGRVTQTGINVLRTLMRMAGYSADPDNIMKKT